MSPAARDARCRQALLLIVALVQSPHLGDAERRMYLDEAAALVAAMDAGGAAWHGELALLVQDLVAQWYRRPHGLDERREIWASERVGIEQRLRGLQIRVLGQLVEELRAAGAVARPGVAA
jgi:hypothetical protein